MKNENEQTDLNQPDVIDETADRDAEVEPPDDDLETETEPLSDEVELEEQLDEEELDDSADLDAGESDVTTSVSNPALEKVQSQVGQLSQAVTQMADLMGQLVQGNRNAAPPPVPDLTDNIRVPDDVEAMTQREAAEYALREAGKITRKNLQQMQQAVGMQMATMGEIMNVLLEGHNDRDNIYAALQMMQSSPGIKFPQALIVARGLAAQKEIGSLKQKAQQQDKANRKRAHKAKQSARPPTPAGKKKVRYATDREAFEASWREQGG